MKLIDGISSYHTASLDTPSSFQGQQSAYTVQQYQYDFENFFHPFVGALIQQLNQTDIAGMLSPEFLSSSSCFYKYQNSDYVPNVDLTDSVVGLEQQQIDVSPGGPYAGYNWELTYHIPVAIAVHHSNNQRFPEAQKWFHLVFDPTDPQQNYWKSYAFSADGPILGLDKLLTILSTPDPQLMAQDPSGGLIKTKGQIVAGYNAILAKPFDPFVVARTRPSSFQWYVVMKYLDNLIAWGDSLFLQDTVETLNEATL